MKHRSIGERLKRAKSKETKNEIAVEWAIAWKKEYDEIFERLERAIRDDDYDELCISTGQLKAVNGKKFDAIINVINSLSDKN